ncbi:uncharacterized protein LOC122061726 [Macadamia integrifolia]|uniref:uncharacterized protein LOC122061726 n=1 Tax=Macadamia integrifolia TaxID=60698 RepID=UPI001C52CB10|nr:uncharacterized protein LOC122061726 [Macadamia integrifolia]
MGNCLETSRRSQHKQEEQQERHEAERNGRDGFIKEGEGGGLRVKIVLTKEELEWLMLQLKEKRGKRLEDLLEELEKWRGRTDSWKPSLESIRENPEVQES